MTYMNQHLIFPMITKRYKTINIENAIKLLVRCKQLLMARRLAFKVLEQLQDFDAVVTEIRNDVDRFLESSFNPLTTQMRRKIKDESE